MDQHPELREGEVLLGNFVDTSIDPLSDLEGWQGVGWKTKRRGEVAYDVHGSVVEGLFPLFVQREELAAAGSDPDGSIYGTSGTLK